MTDTQQNTPHPEKAPFPNGSGRGREGLKAYSVTEHDEGTGGIVFAKHNVVARRMGANQYSDGDFHSVSCRREPLLDEYAASGVVPASALIDIGWHFECWCGERCDQDSLDERGLPVSGVIGSQHDLIFCCQACFDRRETEKAEQRIFEAEVRQRLEAFVRARLPSVEFINSPDDCRPHFYSSKEDGVWLMHQAILSFDFPVRKYAYGSCRFERDDHLSWRQHGCISVHFSHANGDSEAFAAFLKTQRAAALQGSSS